MRNGSTLATQAKGSLTPLVGTPFTRFVADLEGEGNKAAVIGPLLEHCCCGRRPGFDARGLGPTFGDVGQRARCTAC